MFKILHFLCNLQVDQDRLFDYERLDMPAKDKHSSLFSLFGLFVIKKMKCCDYDTLIQPLLEQGNVGISQGKLKHILYQVSLGILLHQSPKSHY